MEIKLVKTIVETEEMIIQEGPGPLLSIASKHGIGWIWSTYRRDGTDIVETKDAALKALEDDRIRIEREVFKTLD